MSGDQAKIKELQAALGDALHLLEAYLPVEGEEFTFQSEEDASTYHSLLSLWEPTDEQEPVHQAP
jgi:hypothetical protein